MSPAMTALLLGVRDLDRSRRFYAALGWQETSKSEPEVAILESGGLLLCLIPARL